MSWAGRQAASFDLLILAVSDHPLTCSLPPSLPWPPTSCTQLGRQAGSPGTSLLHRGGGHAGGQRAAFLPGVPRAPGTSDPLTGLHRPGEQQQQQNPGATYSGVALATVWMENFSREPASVALITISQNNSSHSRLLEAL